MLPDRVSNPESLINLSTGVLNLGTIDPTFQGSNRRDLDVFKWVSKDSTYYRFNSVSTRDENS